MPRVVDADNPNERVINVNERIERGNAVAEILRALPWFVWATPLWLLAGLILVAVGHDGVAGFSNHVLGWFALVPWIVGVLSAVKAFSWVHGTYNKVRTEAYNRRLLSANVQKAQEGVLTVQYKNESLLADVQIRKQIPGLLVHLAQTGVAFKYDAKGNLEVLGLPAPAGLTSISPIDQGQLGAGAPAGLLGAGSALPTQVLYESVRGQVPAGRFLVGVGASGAVDTIEAKRGGACVWIVGLSGTGKTSTTVIRVEERASIGHKFLGVDPHWFKDDSLYHSIYETIDQDGAVVGPGPYADLFLKPIARNPQESKAVLQFFLDVFDGRQGGRIPKPWQPITLVVDELGALTDATSDDEKEVKEMLKTITRICGQEARNFMMGGIFISQQATELAWLRKVALLVIVHQLMQESEKKLATNDDKAVMLDMKTWPIGRTYVYGVGFGSDGPRTVQQPYFAGRRVNAASGGDDPALAGGDDVEFHHDENESAVVESDLEHKEGIVPALNGDLRTVYNACQQLLQARQSVTSRAVAALIPEFGKDKCNNLLNRLTELGYIQRRKAV